MGWHVGCSISKIKMSHVVMTAGAELCRLYPAQTCIYGPKESPKMVAQSERIGSIRSDVPLNPLNINTPWFVGYKKHDHDIAMVLLSPSFHIFPAINNSCEPALASPVPVHLPAPKEPKVPHRQSRAEGPCTLTQPSTKQSHPIRNLQQNMIYVMLNVKYYHIQVAIMYNSIYIYICLII